MPGQWVRPARTACCHALCAIVVLLVAPPTLRAQNYLRLPESIVFDVPRERYLVSNYQTGDMVEIDPQGVQNRFLIAQDAIQGLEIVGDVVYCGNGGSVRGWNLDTGDLVMNVVIPGVDNLNDVTSDDSGNLYAGDVFGDEIYRIGISDQTYNVFVDGLYQPNGICFDAANDRLLVCSYMINSPIWQVSLVDSSVSIVTTTTFDWCDGICLDEWGRTYVSYWGTRDIYRFEADFGAPEFFYHHGGGPADISYNSQDDILAVPLQSINSYVLLPVEGPASIESGLESGARQRLMLSPNRPNPFNPLTQVEFWVPDEPPSTPASVRIYDIEGRIVRTLAAGLLSPGRHLLEWDGRFDDGDSAPSGVYFCRLRHGSGVIARKMTLTR